MGGREPGTCPGRTLTPEGAGGGPGRRVDPGPFWKGYGREGAISEMSVAVVGEHVNAVMSRGWQVASVVHVWQRGECMAMAREDQRQ